jgi:hypothetical protein
MDSSLVIPAMVGEQGRTKAGIHHSAMLDPGMLRHSDFGTFFLTPIPSQSTPFPQR